MKTTAPAGGARQQSPYGLFCTRAALAALAVSLWIPAADAAPACKPKHSRPRIVLSAMGPCVFDAARLSFEGSAPEQAACLLRGMDETRNLARGKAALPVALAQRIGAQTDLPKPEQMTAYLLSQDYDWDLASSVWFPLSRARDNDPDAPAARYFVLHDTSGPYYGRRAFPADINDGATMNNLRNFKCGDGWEKAHAVINRRGDMLLGHDFGTAWRETKFERAVNFSGALKGLFLHVEMVQPRRRGRRGGDTQTPSPAFTRTQYDRLALLYTMASVRGDVWLIPAFHAAIDSGIRGGHDDPLGFDLEAFARSLASLLDRIHGRAETAAYPDRLGRP